MNHHNPLRKRSVLKSFLSICITVLMLCSFPSSAFAESADNGAAGAVGQQPVPSAAYNLYPEEALYSSPPKAEQTVEPATAPEAEPPVESAPETDSFAGTEESEGTEAAAEEMPAEGEEPDNSDGAYETGISSRAISGPQEVRVGETISLTGSRGYFHQWSASGEGRVTFSATDNQTVQITGVATGTVTIKHTYGDKTEFYTIQVTANDGKYDLYMYTLIPGRQEGSDPDLDKVWNGMGVGSVRNLNPPSSYQIGTIVDDGYGGQGAVIEYNSEQFPSITVDGKLYNYAQTADQKYQEGYYTVNWMRVIVSDGANAGGNDKNPVINSGTTTFHLDGVVTLNEKDRYTVNFALKDAGAADFTLVDPETYSKRVDAGFEAKNLQRPDVREPDTYPQTKLVGGVTYRLDCWYKDEACTQKVDWDIETIDQNTTYYGKYVPAGKSITVEKDVTGGLGDRDKAFAFTYSYTDAGGDIQLGSFQLKDEAVHTLENIPIGVELTLQETNAGGYTTTAEYGTQTVNAPEGKIEEVKTIKVTIDGNTDLILVTNHKDAEPDMGIYLGSPPFLLLFAAVTAVAVVLVICKCRRRYL